MKDTELPKEVVEQFNSALKKLTGFSRREFAAELCEKFFEGKSRKMESILQVGREMVELGLHERRTGIRCIDNYSQRGRKKKKRN